MRYLKKITRKKIKGKTALVRVDLNLESLVDTFRADAILPTILFLLERGARVVIISHRGRPTAQSAEIRNLKFEVRKETKKFTLRPFARILSKKIEKKVIFAPCFNFDEIRRTIGDSQESIFLIENLRFWDGEEKNDSKFARQLASVGDFYVNDAFAVSHRKNASVCAITKFLPSYAGLLMEKEIKNLNRVMRNYKHPFTIIIGGAKISDKICVIKNFWNKADYFLLGGGPANTFFAALDFPVGDSLVDKDILQGSTSQILKLIRKDVGPRKIVLPFDVKIKDRKILDIGEKTIKEYSEIIRGSKTIIWSGPMGLFEKKGFEKGTLGIWEAILANKKAQTFIGGGETVAALRLKRVNKDTNADGRVKYRRKSAYKISINPRLFISTGGGAMLEYLSGKKLPGIEALKSQK